MVGQVLGNLLNIVLDPVLILALDWGIAGAAIATVIGNVAGTLYYVLYYLRGDSQLSIHPRAFTVHEKVCISVLAIGIPASLGPLLMSVSQIIMNMRMAGYGDMALAAMGVAMKVTMMTGMLCMGFATGVQPLLGYCVGTACGRCALHGIGGCFMLPKNRQADAGLKIFSAVRESFS